MNFSRGNNLLYHPLSYVLFIYIVNIKHELTIRYNPSIINHCINVCLIQDVLLSICSVLFLQDESCLINVICVCLYIVISSNILCCVFVVFFLVLCTLGWQFLWIVHFWLALRYSLTFICPFLGIVHFWLALRYSLTFIIYFRDVISFECGETLMMSWSINTTSH